MKAGTVLSGFAAVMNTVGNKLAGETGANLLESLIQPVRLTAHETQHPKTLS